jgi:hypothetical protein
MQVTINKWGDGYENSGLSATVTTNGKQVRVRFRDGEPEDFVMARDLNDAYKIKDLITMAYEAGKRGEEMLLSEINDEG